MHRRTNAYDFIDIERFSKVCDRISKHLIYSICYYEKGSD